MLQQPALHALPAPTITTSSGKRGRSGATPPAQQIVLDECGEKADGKWVHRLRFRPVIAAREGERVAVGTTKRN